MKNPKSETPGTWTRSGFTCRNPNQIRNPKSENRIPPANGAKRLGVSTLRSAATEDGRWLAGNGADTALAPSTLAVGGWRFGVSALHSGVCSHPTPAALQDLAALVGAEDFDHQSQRRQLRRPQREQLLGHAGFAEPPVQQLEHRRVGALLLQRVRGPVAPRALT